MCLAGEKDSRLLQTPGCCERSESRILPILTSSSVQAGRQPTRTPSHPSRRREGAEEPDGASDLNVRPLPRPAEHLAVAPRRQ